MLSIVADVAVMAPVDEPVCGAVDDSAVSVTVRTCTRIIAHHSYVAKFRYLN